MSEEKMRASFEAWVRKDKSFYWRWLDRIDGDPEYCAGDIQRLWEAWQVAQQEREAGAVYQRQFIPGNWKDVTEEEFNLLPDFYPRRIVYPAPQYAQAIETAAIMKCVELCRQLDDEPRKDQDYASAGDCIDSLLALIPQDGRTQLEQKCIEVANAAFDFGYYDCESPAVDCVEPKLRAIVRSVPPLDSER